MNQNVRHLSSALEMIEHHEGRLLELTMKGKLTTADYKLFLPEIERLIAKHGKLRMLVVFRDFHGWKPGALWEDIKFDVKHHSDIERLAMVGETNWQKWMAGFCRPFTSASIGYFDTSEIDRAREWITEGLNG
jgi:hypothetical protein